MQSKPKANSVVTTGHENGVLWWQVAGVGKLTLDVDKVHAAIKSQAMYEGLSDRIVDKAALGFIKSENRYATAREKFEAMRTLVEHYATGTAEWSMKPSGGGVDNSGLTIEAIRRVQGYETTALAEAYAEKYAAKAHAGDRKAALKYLATANLKIATAILAIKQERLGVPAVDANAELDDLIEGE